MDAVQHIGDEIILHIGAPEIIRHGAHGGGNQEQHIIFVVEQGFELLFYGDIVGIFRGLLDILHHTLSGIEVFNQQQRNRQHRYAANQYPERVQRLVRLNHIGKQHTVDDHANQGAGYQRPAQLSGIGHLFPVCNITGSQGDDIGIEQIIEAGSQQVIDDISHIKIDPEHALRAGSRLQEHQHTREDGHKSENQIPGPHTPLAGFGVLHQISRDQSHRHGQDTRAHGHPVVERSQALVDLPRHIASHRQRHLLHDVDLQQRGDGVNQHNQSQGAYHMTQDKLFSGHRPGGGFAVHEMLFKQTVAQQNPFLFLFPHSFLLASCHAAPT